MTLNMKETPSQFGWIRSFPPAHSTCVRTIREQLAYTFLAPVKSVTGVREKCFWGVPFDPSLRDGFPAGFLLLFASELAEAPFGAVSPDFESRIHAGITDPEGMDPCIWKSMDP